MIFISGSEETEEDCASSSELIKVNHETTQTMLSMLLDFIFGCDIYLL